MKFFQLWKIVWLITLKDLHISVCISVQFLNKEPLYIALGRTLVLEAQFQLQPGEQIILQTWERKNTDGEVRVASSDLTYNSRTFLENNGALLRIVGITNRDYGKYKVTVTAANGDQIYAHRDVLKITNPPNASLSMQCSILSEGAQWDHPVFSWQVNGVNMTNQTGEISEDGSALRLKNLDQNYTCITDSSQGTSRVDVYMKEPDPSPNSCSCSCTVVILFAVLEFFIILVLIGWCCYKKHTSREEAVI